MKAVIAIDVELVRDTMDWVLVAVAVLAAMGTIGAVAVALLGPTWSEHRMRRDVRLVVHRGPWLGVHLSCSRGRSAQRPPLLLTA